MFYFGVPPAGRGGGGASRQERDTHMKDSRNERLRAMFAGRGYYIAIALCLVAAGTIKKESSISSITFFSTFFELRFGV